jgi:hypothetical protein
MGWGFFVELRCTLPTRAWTALKRRTPADFPLDAAWSGVRDPALLAYFSPPSEALASKTFAEAASGDLFAVESVREEVRVGAKTRLRIARLLDREQLGLASVLGALLAGVQQAGGEGTLALVNDGSYAGEDGHELVVQDGTRRRRALRRYAERRDALIAELYPESLEGDEEEDTAAPSIPPERRFGAAPDAATATAEANALYGSHDVDGARDRLSAHVDAGGPLSAELLGNYAALHYSRPADLASRERAVDTLMAALRAREMRASPGLVTTAVLFFGASDRAREALELALRAVDEGLEWSPVLAGGAVASAVILGDPSSARELVDRLGSSVGGFESYPRFFLHFGALKLLLGDSEAAMTSLERAVALDRKLQVDIAGAKELAALRSHPRWTALLAPRPRKR